MSDKNEMPAEDQADEEKVETDNLAPAADAEEKPRSSSRPWLAGLALLVAIAALGLSLMHWQQAADTAVPDEIGAAELAATGERIDEMEGRLGELETRFDGLAGNVDDRDAELEGLEQALASVTSNVDSIQADMARLEDELGDRIQSLTEREGEQRQSDRELENQLLMLEAASLLRLGQERAELAADWPAARQAYRRASSLLQEADDPRLSAVRRTVTRELDELENIETPDWLRIQVRIERLSGQAHRWPRPPMAGQSTASVSADDEAEDDAEAEAGWGDSLKSIFGQLVRVRPRASVALSDEELDLMRRQVGLRLTAAELAAARRDGEELSHHLRSAGNMLTSHFDPTDASVAEALQELEALAEFSPSAAPAGLGRALAELREHMDRS